MFDMMTGCFPSLTTASRGCNRTSGPALVCRAARAVRARTSSRPGRGRSAAPTAIATPAWAEVARALGVDAAHCDRAHQVHGAIGASSAAPAIAPHGDAPLADADILVSDDPRPSRWRFRPPTACRCSSPIAAPARLRRRTPAGAAWPRACREWRCRRSAREFGSRPADLVAAIGPSISGPRYEVGDERARRDSEADRVFRAAASCDRWFAPGRQGRGTGSSMGGRRRAISSSAAGVTARPDSSRRPVHREPSGSSLFVSPRRQGGAARIAAAIRASPPRP